MRFTVAKWRPDGTPHPDAGLVIEAPSGTVVYGMGPIGIPCSAVVWGRRFIRLNGCPPGEFAPCAVAVNGVVYPL